MREFPQALKKAWLRLDVAGVAHDRLQDDPGDLVPVGLKHSPDRLQIVVRRCEWRGKVEINGIEIGTP